LRNRFCQWRVRAAGLFRRIPAPMDGWVLGTPSLTARLRMRCGDAFSVRVLNENWASPSLDEACRLDIDRRRFAWIREVLLLCGDRPQIFARSVIPAASLRGGNRALQVLGNRPLGELLFTSPEASRSETEVALLHPDDWLARRVPTAASRASEAIWARRVVHHLRGRPLLVTEVFLPELTDDGG